MRTFSKFLESAEYNQQLQQIMQRQANELEQAQRMGDINQVIKLMDRHTSEIKAFQAHLSQVRQNLPARNPPQLPDELNIDKLLRRR